MNENVLESAMQASPGFYIVLGLFLVALVILVFAIIKNAKSISIGAVKIDNNRKESVKEPVKASEREAHEIRRNIEEYTRSVVAKQYDQVQPFLQSLRPIFNRLVYSILNEAVASSLNIERIIVVPQEDEPCSVPGSHYKVETVKTYVAEPQTRLFTSLVESTVDSLLLRLEREIHNMLINNNIGKSREDVRAYIHMKSENLIGIIRNCLCDAYNSLSNQNLFDTKAFWLETGITYPQDWIEDKLYKLFVLCLQCRYSDFQD